MAAKIRLRREGKKKQPFYRVVVADSRSPRDGRYIEDLGFYQPLHDPSTISIDAERALHWLRVGAQPSEPVVKLLRIEGIWETFKPGDEGRDRSAKHAARHADAESKRKAAEEREAADAQRLAEAQAAAQAEAEQPEEPLAEVDAETPEATEPAAEGTEPAAEASEPAAEATEPAAEATEPAAEPLAEEPTDADTQEAEAT